MTTLALINIVIGVLNLIGYEYSTLKFKIVNLIIGVLCITLGVSLLTKIL